MMYIATLHQQHRLPPPPGFPALWPHGILPGHMLELSLKCSFSSPHSMLQVLSAPGSFQARSQRDVLC